MNKVNAMRVGEKMPFNEAYDIKSIDYKVFVFPVSGGQLLYGTTMLPEKEIELVRLENPPSKYSQYEYIGFSNHLFKFINVDNPDDILKYRSIELSHALPYINNGRITMKQTYAWKIIDQDDSDSDSESGITIKQYWGRPMPTSFRVQKLNINSLT